MVKFIERFLLVFVWDLHYTSRCHKETGNPHVWFLNIVIFGYFLFPFFSSLMKRHIKPLRLLLVAMLLFWIEIDGGMRWIRWMVSMISMQLHFGYIYGLMNINDVI